MQSLVLRWKSRFSSCVPQKVIGPLGKFLWWKRQKPSLKMWWFTLCWLAFCYNYRDSPSKCHVCPHNVINMWLIQVHVLQILLHKHSYTHIYNPNYANNKSPVSQIHCQPWPSVHSVVIRNDDEWHIQFRRLTKYRPSSHRCKWCQSTFMTMLCFGLAKSWQLILRKGVLDSLDIDVWTPDGWCVFMSHQ